MSERWLITWQCQDRHGNKYATMDVSDGVLEDIIAEKLELQLKIKAGTYTNWVVLSAIEVDVDCTRLKSAVDNYCE